MNATAGYCKNVRQGMSRIPPRNTLMQHLYDRRQRPYQIIDCLLNICGSYKTCRHTGAGRLQ